MCQKGKKIGFFSPSSKHKTTQIEETRIQHWQSTALQKNVLDCYFSIETTQFPNAITLQRHIIF
jgi:hypothetical protein